MALAQPREREAEDRRRADRREEDRRAREQAHENREPPHPDRYARVANHIRGLANIDFNEIGTVVEEVGTLRVVSIFYWHIH